MASISISVSNFEEKDQDLQLDLNVFNELDDNYVRSRLRFLATYVKEHRKDEFTPEDQRTIDGTSGPVHYHGEPVPDAVVYRQITRR